ncbi:MAG TPA: T9SS type A sorting domain-containing protein [Bacteroidales bacterium]|nr:T9SS type A sorting domain-containing protein [Bacteroidales bacterium]HPS15929.1 T9SS type A sorting domain-containing protein [Bacteroidales bacterium]
MNKKIIHILIVLLFPVLINAQEIVTGLYTNPVLKDMKTIHAERKFSGMLKLPFFDDFSTVSVFPDDTLWTDKYVFINSSYCKNPPTYGVATFDALNDSGALYTNATAYSFIADSLTSNFIKLDSIYGIDTVALTIGDSVYLSFLYQPQGISNAPETEDSLVLEFYAPLTGEWKHVWSSEGSTMAQFYAKHGKWFQQVMIPITDSATYFHKGFRFRFYNYASLANNSMPSWAGNVDQWNLDYIYLDKDRSIADTAYRDIAFVEPAPSALKNYYSMPWSQYCDNPATEMKDTLYMTITNLDTVEYNSSYRFGVFNENETNVYSYDGGSWNVYPYSQAGYQNYQPHARPPVEFDYPCNSSDSASFRIVHLIKEGMVGDNHRQNDTVVFNQKFYNYYAYDDGTPEGGYGLTPANSMLAYKFTLNHPDTLRAIDMFFNQTYNNASQQYFNLTIWNDGSGSPKDIIYQQTSLKPQFEDSLNKFYRYAVNDETLILSGTFYVGWVQVTADNLNLGFDKNNDAHSNIYFNTGSGWMNSIYSGALMIHPVLGKKLPVYANISEIAENTGEIKTYPNPSSGENITICLPNKINKDNSEFIIHVFDILGNEVYKSPFSKNIDISDLQNGIYLLSITSNSSKIKYFTKLSILK